MFNRSLIACSAHARGKWRRFDAIEPRRRVSLKKCFLFTVKPTESQRGVAAASLELLRPEVVLSESNRRSFIERLRDARIPRRSNENASQAAVLVPLCLRGGELGFLYTLRSTRLNSNRGQVSFPGGMHDEGDPNLEATALRETWEELGIAREKISVWTAGNPIDKTNVRVMPVFGYLGEVEPDALKINRKEVEEAFFLSLKNLCDPSLCRYTQFRDGYTLPVYLGGKHRIWGFTATLTHVVLKCLVPDAYEHKLVYLQPILPEVKGDFENNARSS